jgi:hypothetical protein
VANITDNREECFLVVVIMRGNGKLRKPFAVQILLRHKQPQNVGYSKYFGSMIADDKRCTREINPGLRSQKQSSTRRRLFSAADWIINLRTKPVN